MRIKGLEHVAVVVADLHKVGSILRDAFGLVPDEVENVEKDRVQVMKFSLGNTDLELVTPTDEMSAVSRFIDKKGEGLHHICLAVEDIDEAMAELKEKGVVLIDQEPRLGATGCRVAFVHPKSVGGVLVELSEKREDNGE